MSKFALIDVSSTECDVHPSKFDADKIYALSQSIITNNGLLVPVVVVQINPFTFKVIGNHIGYYASILAKQHDPRKFEMFNAFIVSDEQSAVDQLSILGV